MKYQLIKLDATDTGQAQWLDYTPGEEPGTVSRGELGEALRQCAGKPAVLLVPGEQVLITQVELPIRQMAKLRKAVPFALEEQLASDVDELHFALGPAQGDVRGVVVVDNSLMNEWTVELAELGVMPRVIVPDVLTLPWHEDEWSILIDGNRALVRTGPVRGFVCERDNLPLMIEGWLEHEPPPTIVRYWNCSDGPDFQWPEKDQQAAPPIKAYSCGGGALRVLALGWEPRGGLNLLQDRYNQQADVLKLLKPWRWAAALAAIWLVLSLGQTWLHRQQLEKQANALQKRAEQIYRRTFPGARRIVNPRVQMEQKLRALKGGGQSEQGGLLELLARSSQVLNQQRGIKLEKIGFKNGELSLDVTAPTLSQLDGLKQKLASIDGLAAELKSADSAGNQASAQIRVRKL